MLFTVLSWLEKVCGQTYHFQFFLLGLFMVLVLGLQFSELLISLITKWLFRKLSTTITYLILSKAPDFGDIPFHRWENGGSERLRAIK